MRRALRVLLLLVETLNAFHAICVLQWFWDVMLLRVHAHVAVKQRDFLVLLLRMDVSFAERVGVLAQILLRELVELQEMFFEEILFRLLFG